MASARREHRPFFFCYFEILKLEEPNLILRNIPAWCAPRVLRARLRCGSRATCHRARRGFGDGMRSCTANASRRQLSDISWPVRRAGAPHVTDRQCDWPGVPGAYAPPCTSQSSENRTAADAWDHLREAPTEKSPRPADRHHSKQKSVVSLPLV